MSVEIHASRWLPVSVSQGETIPTQGGEAVWGTFPSLMRYSLMGLSINTPCPLPAQDSTMSHSSSCDKDWNRLRQIPQQGPQMRQGSPGLPGCPLSQT